MQCNDFEINEDRFLLNSITKACVFKNDVVKTQLPIQKTLLNQILHEVSKIFSSQPYLMRLYQALFSTAYFGLFRIGELTTGDHPIKARDVHVGVNKKKLLFLLHTSKTHWKNVKPQTVKITSQDVKLVMGESNINRAKRGHCFCPYNILIQYVEM